MTIECSLAEQTTLYVNKLMYGSDCDIEELRIELYKLYSYLFILESLETANDCEYHIPVELIQKIEKYKKSINKRKSKFCNNC